MRSITSLHKDLHLSWAHSYTRCVDTSCSSLNICMLLCNHEIFYIKHYLIYFKCAIHHLNSLTLSHHRCMCRMINKYHYIKASTHINSYIHKQQISLYKGIHPYHQLLSQESPLHNYHAWYKQATD